MKLRIRGDSIRLRLTKPDVATLVEKRTVGESMRMSPNAAFEYRLTSNRAAAAARVALTGNVLEVQLPQAQVNAWARSNEVGIEAWQKNGSEDGLLVLVEKDFPCLTARPYEDDSDAFDRPNSPDTGE
jgi:hypothetical protein